MQTIKVEMVLNLKTAKTLGLTFPLPLLARAERSDRIRRYGDSVAIAA
jgi:hypothetical protein